MILRKKAAILRQYPDAKITASDSQSRLSDTRATYPSPMSGPMIAARWGYCYIAPAFLPAIQMDARAHLDQKQGIDERGRDASLRQDRRKNTRIGDRIVTAVPVYRNFGTAGQATRGVPAESTQQAMAAPIPNVPAPARAAGTAQWRRFRDPRAIALDRCGVRSMSAWQRWNEKTGMPAKSWHTRMHQ